MTEEKSWVETDLLKRKFYARFEKCFFTVSFSLKKKCKLRIKLVQRWPGWSEFLSESSQNNFKVFGKKLIEMNQKDNLVSARARTEGLLRVKQT